MAAASDGASTLAAVNTRDGVEVLLLSGGSMIAQPFLLPGSNEGSNPAVAFDGGNYLVVWDGAPDSLIHGARVSPQLPVSTVVTPCQMDDVQRRSQNGWAS